MTPLPGLAPGPMQGVRVLEIGDRGEHTGKLLADAGADVIRIEPPGGSSRRDVGPFPGDRPDRNACLTFLYLNTNKRGVTLDVTTPQGRDLWRRLVDTADIVLDSSGVDVLEAAGAGYDALGAPARVVWCSITPFGLTGPWRDWAANDLVSMALGGPVMSNGYDDHELPPIRPEGEHSLWITATYAVSASVAALLLRQRTGAGQLVDLSIHESVAATTEGAFTNWEYNQAVVKRRTGRHATVADPADWQYRCADGEYVVLVGAGVPRSKLAWDYLMNWMRESDMVGELDDPRFYRAIFIDPATGTAERRAIEIQVGKFVQTLPGEVVYQRAQEGHLGWTRVRRPEENLDDAHWHDRGFFVPAEVPGRAEPVLYPSVPYLSSTHAGRPARHGPLVGEHNFEVLSKELGLSAADLAGLARAGVV
ncbi:MAG: CoA transferase [Dehalococcoidia bacterium]|nr:CoA transferase [Dehalococcoidia bacterium]